VEGPNGFERSITLSAAAGEHELSAIRTLVLRLVPLPSRDLPFSFVIEKLWSTHRLHLHSKGLQVIEI